MISLREGMANPAKALASLRKPLGEQRVAPVGAKALPQPKGRPRKPHRPGVMNKLEARYAKHLEGRQRRGEIVWWGFEVVRFRLANRTWYGADFAIMLPDGSLELHETKGFMEPQDSVKLKVTADLYWMFPVNLVTESAPGVFTITEVGR